MMRVTKLAKDDERTVLDLLEGGCYGVASKANRQPFAHSSSKAVRSDAKHIPVFSMQAGGPA